MSEGEDIIEEEPVFSEIPDNDEPVEKENVVQEEATPEKPSGEPMGIIVDWIRQTGVARSSRQRDISDTVRERMHLKLKEYLHIEGLDEAIDNLTNQVSTWVDQIAYDAEKELLAQPAVKKITKKFPGMDDILYRIQITPNNKLAVETTSYFEVAERKNKITKPMTMNDFKKFNDWAENLINVSEAWTNWVNDTFFEAFCMYNKLADNRDLASTDQYVNWIGKKRKEALNWKRAQMSINEWSKRWEDWAALTKKNMDK